MLRVWKRSAFNLNGIFNRSLSSIKLHQCVRVLIHLKENFKKKIRKEKKNTSKLAFMKFLHELGLQSDVEERPFAEVSASSCQLECLALKSHD